MSPATWVCGARVRDPDRSAARHRVPRRRGLLERADRTPRRRGADSHVGAGDQHPRVMFVRSRMRIRTAPSTVSSRPSNSNRSSMCRKRSFGTDGRGRRPARAAVCRIPCRILCLAYVKRVCQCRAPNAQAAPARSHDRYSWGTDRAALKRWWPPITSPRRLQNPRPRREVRCSTPAPPDSAGWQLSLSGAARPRRQSSRPADRGGRVVVR